MSESPKKITVTDLRNGTRSVLEDAHFRGRRYVVERAGQPMAVLLGIDDFNCLTQAAEDRARQELDTQGSNVSLRSRRGA